ncbi:MAG: hypothetical protein V4726_19275 [Verrucomicrobiota bacterium]
MRNLLSATRLFRLHAARLREPLVQVWLMAGMALILVIMGHVRVVRQSGDWKNMGTQSAARLLMAGANLQWTDDFAPAAAARSRPVIALTVSGSRPDSTPPAPVDTLVDWRGQMAAAASRSWEYLEKAQRRMIDSTVRPATGVSVSLAWTGDPRGNASLHALECQRLGQSDASTFVIGNGSRSKDGGLEIPRPLQPESPVVVTLIGTPLSVTSGQKAALGELLNYLEARFGPVECHS